MNDLIEAIKDGLTEIRAEYQEIIEQISPLQKRKAFLEEKIKTMEHLLSLEKNAILPSDALKEDISEGAPKSKSEPLGGVLIGKSPMKFYKELAQNYFKDTQFREKDIRELANKEGLRVNEELIAGSYSRGIIAKLLEKGFLEKVDRGLYQTKKSKAADLIERIGDI